MVISGGSDFLVHFGSLFASAEVAGWPWESDDSQFGKRTNWPILGLDSVEAVASVEISDAGLVLVITERDVSGEADERTADTNVVFEASVSFDDGTVVVNGAALDYTIESIRLVISQFNERAPG